MLHNLYYDIVVKNKNPIPNISILLVALNDFSKNKLEKVGTKKSGRIYFEFIPSPFKLLFLPERLYTPLIMKVGLERYFYINVFFSIYSMSQPYISLYLDHKIADAASTYKKALTYGPIIPSNFHLEKFFSPYFLDNNDYGVIPNTYPNVSFANTLVNDFNSANNTSFTIRQDNDIFHFMFKKLMDSEKRIDQTIAPEIRFKPFINVCNSNPTLLNNINDHEIQNFDYLLFMADDNCIKGTDDCSLTETADSLQDMLQNISSDFNITKDKAISISDKINSYNCPASWYKHGDFQMT